MNDGTIPKELERVSKGIMILQGIVKAKKDIKNLPNSKLKDDILSQIQRILDMKDTLVPERGTVQPSLRVDTKPDQVPISQIEFYRAKCSDALHFVEQLDALIPQNNRTAQANQLFSSLRTVLTWTR